MFSIIIPLYNKAATIGTTIESVLRQTYADFELLIVDDGSTDDSASVVKTFSDSRVKLLQQANKGVCAARNFGGVNPQMTGYYFSMQTTVCFPIAWKH